MNAVVQVICYSKKDFPAIGENFIFDGKIYSVKAVEKALTINKYCNRKRLVIHFVNVLI